MAYNNSQQGVGGRGGVEGSGGGSGSGSGIGGGGGSSGNRGSRGSIGETGFNGARLSMARWFANSILPKPPTKSTENRNSLNIQSNQRNQSQPPKKENLDSWVMMDSDMEEVIIDFNDIKNQPPHKETTEELNAAINQVIEDVAKLLSSDEKSASFSILPEKLLPANKENLTPFHDRFCKVKMKMDLQPEFQRFQTGLKIKAIEGALRNVNIVESIPNLWNQTIISGIDTKVGELLKMTSNMLKECVSVVGIPKEATLVEKIRLKKLMEFCDTVHKRTVQRVSTFKQLLSTETSNILEETSRTYRGKTNVETALYLQKQFTEMLGNNLDHLERLATELDNATANILAALKAIPDDDCSSCAPRKRKGDHVPSDKESPSSTPSTSPSVSTNSQLDWNASIAPRIMKKRKTWANEESWEYRHIMAPRISQSTTLKDLCVVKICQNLAVIPNLQYRLPEEMLQAVITKLVNSRNINKITLEMVLSPFSQTLILDNCSQVKYEACSLIAKTCRQLRTLSLRGCGNVTNQGLIEIAQSLPYLEHVNIDGCHLVSTLAVQEIIRNCPQLASLSMRSLAQITDNGFANLLEKCPHMVSLNLRACANLTDEALKYITSNIQELDLTECPNITTAGYQSLFSRCKQLIVLKVSGNNITDRCIELVVGNCKNLQVLECVGCDSLTDYSVSLISRCYQLSSLSLSQCKGATVNGFYTDATVTRGFSSLHTIDLSRCVNINDLAIAQIAYIYPHLRSINLSFCEEITDMSIKSIVDHCRELEEFELANCNKLSDVSICYLAQRCHSIRKLSLYNCQMITDESICEVARNCPDLVLLDVSSCEKVTDRSVFELAMNCPKIEVLCFEETKVTDEGIKMIAKACPQLTTIKLAYCKGIMDEGVLELAKGCPDIKSLDLSYCNNVSLGVLQRSLDQWPKLTELNLRGYNFDWNTPDPTTAASSSGLVSQNSTFSLRPLRGIRHLNLKMLNVSWCKNLTDSEVGLIGKGCPCLVSLDLAWCGKLTPTSLVTLSRDCPELKNLNIRGCTRISHISKQFLASNRVMIYK